MRLGDERAGAADGLARSRPEWFLGFLFLETFTDRETHGSEARGSVNQARRRLCSPSPTADGLKGARPSLQEPSPSPWGLMVSRGSAGDSRRGLTQMVFAWVLVTQGPSAEHNGKPVSPAPEVFLRCVPQAGS